MSVCMLSCVRLFATPWTVAHQVPLSKEFFKQENWSGLPFLKEEMLKSLLSQFENDPKTLWETNMFGKSLHMLVNEGLNNKFT